MPINWKVKTVEITTQRTGVISVVIFVSTITAFTFHMPFLGFLALGFFSPIVYEYYSGKKCEVSEVGATAGFSTITWDRVKSVKIDENAVQLSPFESESRLDATRGVRLVFDESVDREQVMEIIRTHVGKDVRFLEG